jgi:hypothetical protein
MKKIILVLGFLCSQLSYAQSSAVYLISPIEFAENNMVRESIKDQCNLPVKVESAILMQARRLKLKVSTIDKDTVPGDGTLMRVTILDADGAAGGMYSGQKSVTMRTELIQQGKVIAAHEFDSHVTMTSLFSGSCSIFEKLVKGFSKKHTVWVMGQLGIEKPAKGGRKAKAEKNDDESKTSDEDDDSNKSE